jgi:UDP-N-acetylmuramoyl-L-alanyl-D-glutamate--2,6-diaminopimelate ligase
MKISKIIKTIECKTNITDDFDIKGINYDSRKVEKGDLFFCISGFKVDGHRFATKAIKSGASALVVSRMLDIDFPQILVEDDRKAMALISCAFYDHPAKKLKMIGVTGTNGKTTITYLTKAVLEKCGHKVGIIGTIQNMIGDEVIYASHTTPESPDLNRLIDDMVKKGCDYLIMEVSSHSLQLDRVTGITFDIGMFTNLTQDHLDFHGDFENYSKAKAKLFAQSNVSILNADDSAYKPMQSASKGKTYLYGIDQKGDFSADNITVEATGIDFDYIKNGDKIDRISMKLTGYFNVSNTLCVLGLCDVLGLDFKKCADALSKIPSVDGRCQVLEAKGKEFSIILDYAHTPDSLQSTILSVNRFAKAKVITVFGCGGDRDAGKRPLMGEISGRLSDFSIITSDNPRTESPMDIIDQIVPGMKRSDGEYVIIENRRDAIKHALEIAKKDDIVILAGKGHETYQEINGVRSDFDEKIIVSKLLKKDIK